MFRRRKHSNPEIVGVIKKGKATGKTSLRRLQMESAMGTKAAVLREDDGSIIRDGKGAPILVGGRTPSITMQIWLGKQLLGQADKREVGKPGDFQQEPVDLTDEALAEVIRQGEILEAKHRSKTASGGNGSDGDNGDSPS